MEGYLYKIGRYTNFCYMSYIYVYEDDITVNILINIIYKIYLMAII